jgi:hypothetical protein
LFFCFSIVIRRKDSINIKLASRFSECGCILAQSHGEWLFWSCSQRSPPKNNEHIWIIRTNTQSIFKMLYQQSTSKKAACNFHSNMQHALECSKGLNSACLDQHRI